MTETESEIDALPHTEYHIYTTDHNRDPIHIHVPEDVVEDMRALIDEDFPVDRSDWLAKFIRDLGDGIWLFFQPDDPDNSEFRYCPMRGESHRVFGSTWDHQVWIDGSFLMVSTGPPADRKQHHYKGIREEVVLDEHREQYMDELIEDEELGGWDTEWIER